MRPERAAAAIAMALGLALAGWGAARFAYGQTKLAAAAPAPLAPRLEPAGVDGQLCALLVGDSRIAEWPLDLAPQPAAKAGYPGAAVANIGPVVPHLLERTRPRLLVLVAGYNDAVAAAAAGSAAGDRIIDGAVGAIAGMVRNGKTRGVKVVVFTVAAPIAVEPWKRLLLPTETHTRIAALNGRIRTLVSRHGVTLVDADRVLLRGSAAEVAARRRDSVHWSRAGYEALAAALEAAEAAPCRPNLSFSPLWQALALAPTTMAANGTGAGARRSGLARPA